MKINQLKQITILSNTFDIVWNKTHNGGSFSFGSGVIEIGTQCLKKEPLYVYSIISHEVMEAIQVTMGTRFTNSREPDKYTFLQTHQEFENAIQLHTEIMVKFLKL
jgi:hypothetical protein